MGQGLGKNSPVVLSLGRENYEALLNRHGQWTRWRQSTKCTCIDSHTQQPDIHCRRCGGRGLIYDYQSDMYVQCVVMAKDTSGILYLNNEFIKDELVKVYDNNGNVYEAVKKDIYIVFNQPTEKSRYYNILLKRSILEHCEKVELTRNGKFFIAESLKTEKSKIDGVFYYAPCDIEHIDRVIDSNNEEFEIAEIRQNQILLKTKKIIVHREFLDEDEEITIEPYAPLMAEGVAFVRPFVFGILNQNLNKADFNAMVEAQGDAVVIFPYYCDVAEGDVLTVLAGTITQKDILVKTGSEHEPLPAFFVAEITKIIDEDGNEFINGVDYVLTGTNEIKWLTDKIEIGDTYSVNYKVYPTYSVTRNIPTLRSSENQRFPKKAIVKLMSSYSEQRKVNRQGSNK